MLADELLEVELLEKACEGTEGTEGALELAEVGLEVPAELTIGGTEGGGEKEPRGAAALSGVGRRDGGRVNCLA